MINIIAPDDDYDDYEDYFEDAFDLRERYPDHEIPERVYAERPNKELLKRMLADNRALILQLIKLSPPQLDKIDMPEQVRTNILETKRIQTKHVAFKRQLMYTTRLISDPDANIEQIRKQFDNLHKPQRAAVAQLHRIETWRDRLLVGDKQVMEELVQRFPNLDFQQVRQWVRNAQKEQQLNKPPKSARLLFQYLQDLEQASAATETDHNNDDNDDDKLGST